MGFSLDPRHVEGNVFGETGKWKYTVQLDYTGGDWDNWDLWSEARAALARATRRRISGVSLVAIPSGWTLVVLEPYGRNSHPIMVTA